jgi:fumarylacetoacetase
MLKRSNIAAANAPGCAFPLNNLPLGVFSTGGTLRCGVAIGDRVLDVAATGTFDPGLFATPDWNALMAAGPAAWDAFRAHLTAMLAEGAPVPGALIPLSAVTLHMPFRVAEYTDFYAGRHHAFNVGTMFRGAENALPPNWLHIPIGYNGRASSVVVSGTPVRRPWGQVKGPDHAAPTFQPSRRFDLELELGAIIGTPSDRPVTVAEAEAMIFGYVLLNDWSARDIQAWEYQPLGPFQAKATATTVSPWIVMAETLRGHRTPTPPREVPLLPYLHEPHAMGLDVDLAVALNGHPISRTNADQLYYSFPQQIAHHTSSGCGMRTGDLIGSGTISGPERHQRGSLLELSWGGKEPLDTPSGPRSFIEDHDTITLTGAARGDGYVIGFGDCAGQVLPAQDTPYARTT